MIGWLTKLFEKNKEIKRKRISKSRKELIVNMYEEGHARKFIATALDVSYSTVCRTIKGQR